MMKFIKSLIKYVYWKIIELSWNFVTNKENSLIKNNEFSIGLVTYVDRYEIFFKKLIHKLSIIFPDTEIVVAINGYYDQKIQNEYLIDINKFLSKYKNIKIIQFREPQSLSKLWNLLILNSEFNKTLILNDDLNITPSFRSNLIKSNILKTEISIINNSWSHFLISKNIINKIGWFDERFPGVGNEDEDYECRLSLNNIECKSYKVSGVKNFVFKTINFSYGKNISITNQKYIKENKLFFDEKWEVSKEHKSGFNYVRILNAFVKLRNGMETPFFYDIDLEIKNSEI